jgi:hypothetical protein
MVQHVPEFSALTSCDCVVAYTFCFVLRVNSLEVLSNFLPRFFKDLV